MSLWLVLIALHAVFAVMCFASGFALLSPSRLRSCAWLMSAFVISLTGMVVFMMAATISHWYDISTTEQVVFSGLPLLGLYMLYRGVRAKRHLERGRSSEYIDGIGFSLISLFNGFIIVALIDLQVHPIIIPLVAIGGTIIGIRYVNSAKRKLSEDRMWQ